MHQEKPTAAETGSRWLRVGVLTFTVVGPIIRTLVEFMRQPKQSPEEQAETIQNNISISEAMALSQLDDIPLARRQRTAEQAQELHRQSKQLHSQAQQLRQATRTENKQRRQLNKMVKQLQKAGIDWNEELRQRSGDQSEGLVVQTNKITSDALDRSKQATQDLTKRSSKATNRLLKRGRALSQQATERSSDALSDWTERGSHLTRDLMKRTTEFGHDVSERGQQLLKPVRKRNSTFWTIFGFSFGLVAATVVTYLLVRRRMLQQEEAEQSQHIELPQNGDMMTTSGTTRPAGEIHHIDSDGTAVATLQAVDVAADKVEVPADATFVGVISTKQYYPIAAIPDAPDLVYFVSEEEAKVQGFNVAG